MKTILKLTKNLLIFLVILVVILVLFLYVYYGIYSRGLNKKEAAIRAKGRVTLVPVADTALPSQPWLNLLPVPKKVVFRNGTCSLPDNVTFSLPQADRAVADSFFTGMSGIRAAYRQGGGFLVCARDTGLRGEAYRLTLAPGGVRIFYGTPEGLHDALTSLKVLWRNYSNVIPCVDLEDAPDLAVRGVMLDIGRNKIPKLETLLELAQLLADLKYNHLELYIEGFAFAYPSFTELWEGRETPLTGSEIRQLDAFCRKNFIDLVPNQNTFGHMASWLATDAYKDLAECPNGMKMMGLISMKTTLDPSDPRSVELVSKMTDDLLPNFTSGYYNMNMDEPFELGQGKSKKLCREQGVGEVYLGYALKMHELATSRNKKLMMWGDIALRHPAILGKIPKDITLLDWGYESLYPFERNAKRLDSAGVSFILCPGTSSWTSITGRTQNMLDNIEKAAVNAVKYNGKGILVTDWGDMGHWQYLPVSYAGYATGGALAWNSGSRGTMQLSRFLDSYVFRDPSGRMGNSVLLLGKYNQYEEFLMLNMTTSMLSFQLGLRDRVMTDAIFDKIISGLTVMMKDLAPELIDTIVNRYEGRKPFDYQGLMTFVDKQEQVIGIVSLQGPDSALVKAEYLNAIRLIRLGASLRQYTTTPWHNRDGEQKTQLERMSRLCSEYLAENQRLWLERNKPGGYDLSVASLTNLQKSLTAQLAILGKPAPTRIWHRFTEKLAASAAVIYLKLFT